MPTLVVPFRDVEGKSRLGALSDSSRAVLARAMLADVLEACLAVGQTFVVADNPSVAGGATHVGDPGGGQAAAVRAGLEAATFVGARGPYTIVNADLPCVTARDLLALAGAVPPGGLAYAPAADGTTNAVAVDTPGLFVPAYGPGSAERFAEATALTRIVDAPNLRDDVDTIADLDRLRDRVGPHTRRALAELGLGAAA